MELQDVFILYEEKLTQVEQRIRGPHFPGPGQYSHGSFSSHHRLISENRLERVFITKRKKKLITVLNTPIAEE